MWSCRWLPCKSFNNQKFCLGVGWKKNNHDIWRSCVLVNNGGFGSINIVFIIGFALSLGPVPWIIMSEIFPTDARGVASSIATGANWLSNLIVVLLFPTIKDKVGANSFFIFAGGMVLFILFTILVVYETKNKTIEELTKDI
jgi:predicted MFS family arabinose efflux permease